MNKRSKGQSGIDDVEVKGNDHFYVITGGPGVGKTSLINELWKRNYRIVPEIARELIREQIEVNGNALPWKDKELYKNEMFERSIQSYERTEKGCSTLKAIFFDRGFLDVICYATLIGSKIDGRMDTYAKNWRYNRNVFILPPWQEIYETDDERRQNWDEVLLTHGKMIETYRNYGYEIVEIPKKPIEERVDFIQCFIERNRNKP